MNKKSSSKLFADLSYDEMVDIILSKEPSLRDLIRKTLILLRATIVAIARLQIVADCKLRSPPEFFSELRKMMCQIGAITQRFEELFNENKKTPVDAEVSTQLPIKENYEI